MKMKKLSLTAAILVVLGLASPAPRAQAYHYDYYYGACGWDFSYRDYPPRQERFSRDPAARNRPEAHSRTVHPASELRLEESPNVGLGHLLGAILSGGRRN